MKRIYLLIAAALMAILGVDANAQDANEAQKAVEKAAAAIAEAPEKKVEAPKPVYWTNSIMTNLNFIQSMYSNWAKGGYNNYALSAYVDANANYKKDDLYWNNRLQLDYGFLFSEDKPILQKNKDRILLESTAGYKATKTLNYTAKFTFMSQFSKGYTYPVPSSPADPNNITVQEWKNARLLKSSAFAPAIINLGLGADWIPNNWLTVNLAPLTGGFTIVGEEKLRKNYGMDRKKEFADLTAYPDQKDADNKYYITGNYYRAARFEFGAQLTADAKMRINDNFEASTHLLLFSNYLDHPENIRVNWDNRLMWKVAKYFSVNLTTNLIYDDKVLVVTNKYPDGHKSVQFYEALQFGFTYTFASKK